MEEKNLEKPMDDSSSSAIASNNEEYNAEYTENVTDASAAELNDTPLSNTSDLASADEQEAPSDTLSDIGGFPFIDDEFTAGEIPSKHTEAETDNISTDEDDTEPSGGGIVYPFVAYEEPEENDIEEPTKADASDDGKKPFKADGIFEFVELFVFTIAAVMLMLSFVFRHSIVDGDSMQNTLQNGEHLIISNLFYRPEQFDIVVFEDRSTGFSKPIIKRIIALEGDTVEINSLGEVSVNGVPLNEDEYKFIDGYDHLVNIKYTVPEGEVFVMGDHRNESSDSRYFGSIDEDTILGKVVLRFYPFNTFKLF